MYIISQMFPSVLLTLRKVVSESVLACMPDVDHDDLVHWVFIAKLLMFKKCRQL